MPDFARFDLSTVTIPNEIGPFEVFVTGFVIDAELVDDNKRVMLTCFGTGDPQKRYGHIMQTHMSVKLYSSIMFGAYFKLAHKRYLLMTVL